MEKVNLHFLLQSSDGNEIIFDTEATLEYGQGLIILNFIEQTDLELKTKVLIEPQKVELMREGMLKMHLIFTEGIVTTATMKTNFDYEISMENETLHLEVHENWLDVVYRTTMDKERGVTHHLRLKWQK